MRPQSHYIKHVITMFRYTCWSKHFKWCCCPFIPLASFSYSSLPLKSQTSLQWKSDLTREVTYLGRYCFYQWHQMCLTSHWLIISISESVLAHVSYKLTVYFCGSRSVQWCRLYQRYTSKVKAFKSKLWFLKHMQNIEQYVVYVSTIFTELLV
jgi:hypothetical protein